MTAIFNVRAMVDPQSLCRILGHFSQAWLTPLCVEARVDDGTLTCLCVVDAIDQATAMRIMRKMEASTLVLSAELRFEAC